MKIYIDCEARCQVLRIEKLWDDESRDHYQLWISMYHSYAMGFWMRLRGAWDYLRWGEYNFNDMRIDDKDVQALIDFLEEVKKSEVEK